MVDTARLLRSVDLIALASNYTKLAKRGREYVGLCPFHKDTTPSFHVIPHKNFAHCMSCRWSGDAIDLVCELDGVDFREACKRLSTRHDVIHAVRSTDSHRITAPPPADASPPRMGTLAWGLPKRTWTYRDQQGAVLFYVARYEWRKEGVLHKATPQWTWGSTDNGTTWQWAMAHYHSPRPLYGLDRLSAAPEAKVLIVEGEKAADAASELLPTFAVMAWPGGANAVKKADWSVLKGRNVLIWPDQDQPGVKAAQDVADCLKSIAAKVQIIDVTGSSAIAGWDAADALDAGWTPQDAQLWMRPRIKDVSIKDAEATPVLQPANDNVPDEPTRVFEATWPFRVLGHDGGHYYYHARGTRQIISLKARDHRKEQLIALAPIAFWAQHWPGRGGADYTAAADALLRASECVGIYAGNTIMRGRGAWLDEGRSVFHMGDALIVDGATVGIMDHPSHYIYEAARRFPLNTNHTATTAEANKLIQICKMVRWEQPISAYLLAGWLVCAPVCGIFKWRPHIWLTGPSGAGKSTIVKKIVEPLIQHVGRVVAGATSEAGVRQTILRGDAVPVVFDEAEPKDQAAQYRLKGILDLARIASNGGTIPKGTVDHVGREFTVRTMFMLASINPAVEGWADESRITQLALAANNPKTDGEKAALAQSYTELMKLISESISPEFADALLMRTLLNLKTLQENTATFSNAAASHLGNMRLGDQLGPMLAGSYMLHSLSVISFDEALAWVKARDWVDHTAIESMRDSDRFLQYLMQHPIRYTSSGGQQDRSIGELLAAACSKEETTISKEAAYETILRYGIKPANGLGVEISTTHSAIKRVLRGTEWAMGWRRALMSVDGAKPLKAVRFGPGSPTPAIWLPLERVIGPMRHAVVSDKLH
jgi:putative DNA primase/helicase